MPANKLSEGRKTKKPKPDASLLMWTHICEMKMYAERELKFYGTRRWKFDFALPDRMTAIEIEGGAFTRGRHTRGVGFIKDMEKYNHAALLGWKVLRFTPQQVLSGEAIAFIKQVLDT